jgi:hypothetical protein
MPVGWISPMDRLSAAACHWAAICLPVACRCILAVLIARIDRRAANDMQATTDSTLMIALQPARSVQ